MAEFNGPATWRRSSRCDTMNCVEVAFVGGPDRVLMRNSRQPELSLTVDTQAWRAFCTAVAAGALDRPVAGR